MNYILLFHANLNYAYLPEWRYEFVIRHSYEMIIDTMREQFPTTKYVFEASGYTLDHMAQKTPDVLDKLNDAIQSGQCEFMGSPYAHPMLANFPEEDGRWCIKFALDAYKKHLVKQPTSFWNPECGWQHYLGNIILNAGYKNLLGDFEAFSRSSDGNGNPLRPEIHEIEFSDQPSFYDFSFNYDLPGSERAIHFPFSRLDGIPPESLRVFLRTDRVAQFGVRYFMGMEGYSLEKYLQLVKTYSQQPKTEAEGALIIFADDAEYIGTNGWFRLKYQNEPDHVFEKTADSRQKLINLIRGCSEMGSFITFETACQALPAITDLLNFDDDSAWHGARASTWANTPIARLLRPWQDLVRRKIMQLNMAPDIKRRIWFHLTNSYNSDGQWPPTLPNAPHIVNPSNYKYCFDNLLTADQLVGGVDKSKLPIKPVEVLRQMLTPQAQLIRKKLESPTQIKDRDIVQQLIETCLDFTELEDNHIYILYPAEYESRVNALVEARKLVGGIQIENVSSFPVSAVTTS